MSRTHPAPNNLPMAYTISPRFAYRLTTAFAGLAVLVFVLIGLAWHADGELLDAQQARYRAVQVVGALAELEAATQPRARLALCAAVGDTPEAAGEAGPPQWTQALQRLQEQSFDHAALRERLESLKKALDEWQQSYELPLRQACTSGTRLGAAYVMSLSRVVAPLRERIAKPMQQLHEAENALLRDIDVKLPALQDARVRWWILLSIVAVVLGVVAVIAVRSFSILLVQLQGRLAKEREDRAIVQEHVELAKRQLRIVIDTVHDAVVSFDKRGRIRWINPAAEALFRTTRSATMGAAVTLLLPDFDDVLRKATPPVEGDKRSAWTLTRATLDAQRTRPGGVKERVPVDLSVARSHMEGHHIGLCVVRVWAPGAAAMRPREEIQTIA